MCCLFTIFGWLVDSIQRVWVFIMSCCVSSAICCLILTACTSGIALGYNYSLAEYIDLKVRSDSADNSAQPIKSARRLDDSIVESDSQNRFENSLLKLTAKPPRIPPTTTTAYKEAAKMEELISNFPPGSLDQMKAMQAVVNARKAGLLPDVKRYQEINKNPLTTDQYDKKIQFMNDLLSGRKFHIDRNDIVMPSNPIRDAVPRMDLSGWPKGAIPKYTKNMNFFDSNDADYEFGHPPSFPPRPPTPVPSPIRPSTSPAMQTPKRTDERIGPAMSRTPPNRETPKAVKAFKEDLDKYKQRLLINQYDEPSLKADDFPRRKPDEDDYEEEFKGAPVRRKRIAAFDSKIQDSVDNTTSNSREVATESMMTVNFINDPQNKILKNTKTVNEN
ncbi:hypothetical protein MSG28_010372 [Choristoneura fumiferana]|uniref:Uncharacterized protein n=1 Tax=Choristoneura fumiferana TaxID=7141 RepID=A0ACC0KL03_CHOFU|nr:hypothetical protein MSG28_010372 [Choristoneura fumiferana]